MSEQDRSTGKGKALEPEGSDPKKKPGVTGSHPAQGATGTNPAHSGPHSNPAVPAPGAPGAPGPGTSAARKQTDFQKSQLRSAFQSVDAKARLDFSQSNARPLFDDDDEPTALGRQYDGEIPARELTGRDLWKAVQAPVQSREGRRSADLYQMVINQFAVGKNPRYDPDAPDKPRAHIFVWDVSRAMNCEIPHFVGAKELSLGQTVDWLRHEGPMRGWARANVEDAHQAALAGSLVIALPKEVRTKLMAVVVPCEELHNGKPFVAAAALARGNLLKINEALGGFAVDCFVHH